MEIQINVAGDGKLIESNVGDTIGYYTFVHYYGVSEEGYKVWRIKCSNCRRVLYICLGNEIIDRRLRHNATLLRTKVDEKEEIPCYCKEINSLNLLKNMKSLHGGIVKKCYSVNHVSFNNYGARGVRVCEQWLNRFDGFDSFLKDVGLRPNSTSILHLKEHTFMFNKENCYWGKRKTNVEKIMRTKYRNGGIKYRRKNMKWK